MANGDKKNNDQQELGIYQLYRTTSGCVHRFTTNDSKMITRQQLGPIKPPGFPTPTKLSNESLAMAKVQGQLNTLWIHWWSVWWWPCFHQGTFSIVWTMSIAVAAHGTGARAAAVPRKYKLLDLNTSGCGGFECMEVGISWCTSFLFQHLGLTFERKAKLGVLSLWCTARGS